MTCRPFNALVARQPFDALMTRRPFNALSGDGKVDIPLQETFPADYFGSLTGRFGVKWMFNCGN